MWSSPRRCGFGAAVALALWLPSLAGAQGNSAPERRADVRAFMLGGRSGLASEGHVFGGAHVAITGSRLGGAVQGHLGSGNGYGSRLVAGGVSLQHALRPGVDALALVGAARYHESLDADGRDRAVFGPAASVMLVLPVGPARLAAGVTAWFGSYSGSDAPNAIPGSGLRFIIGVGR